MPSAQTHELSTLNFYIAIDVKFSMHAHLYTYVVYIHNYYALSWRETCVYMYILEQKFKNGYCTKFYAQQL